MNKYSLYFFVITFFSSFYVKAQIADAGLNIDLPTASSITKYEQVPVSLSTGTVNVSIPLYTIQENGISLPISLSYDGSGVKPNQKSSWVGTNWSLNAGGVITRVVNGLADEVYFSGDNGSTPTRTSYINHYDNLNNPNWYNYYDYEDEDVILDLHPDEFYFSMNGYSGSFYLNHLGEWDVKSSSNAKFIVEGQTNEGWGNFALPEKFYSVNGTQIHNIARIYTGFRITTPDGIKYSFGFNPSSIEFTNSNPDNRLYNENYIAKSWFLTKIEHPNGVVFDLDYERKLEAIFTISKYFNSQGAVSTHNNNPVFLLGDIVFGPNGEQNSSSGTYYGLSKLYTTNLKTITSPNFIVNFNIEDSNQLDYDWDSFSIDQVDLKQWMISNNDGPIADPLRPAEEAQFYKDNSKPTKLSSIVVTPNNSSYNVKQINFTYNNDHLSYDENNPERLFLKEVRDGNLPYTFGYVAGAERIPYLTSKTDHWGYHNGVSYFDNPVSGSIENQANAFFLSKNSNFNEMKKGALHYINYPTGLSTTFSYEAHDYSKIVEKQLYSTTNFFEINNLSTNEIAGGLRVSRIQYLSIMTGGVKYKEFEYNLENSDLSSGILGGTPSYFTFSSGSYWHFKDSPIEPMSNTNGSHISYNTVKETEFGYNNENIGHKIYTFSNHDNPIYRDIGPLKIWTNIFDTWRLSEFNSQSSIRGKLLEEVTFNNLNEKVARSKYTYNITYDSPIRCLSVDRMISQGLNTARFTSFEKSRPFFYLSKKEVFSNYENGISPIVSTSNYIYDVNYKVQTEESFFNSKNQLVKSTTKYPFHFNSVPTLDFMVEKNMIAYPVYKHKEVNSKIVSSSFNNYIQHTSDNVVIDIIKTIETNRPIASYIQPIVNNNEVDLDDRFKNQIFYKYDIRGNLIEQQKENKFKTYLWGYNYSKPIAIIDNFSFDDTTTLLNTEMNTTNFYYALQIRDYQQLIDIFNNFRIQLPSNTFLKTYTYNNRLQLNRHQNERGKNTGYAFDQFNRLTSTQDIDNEQLLQYFNYTILNQISND